MKKKRSVFMVAGEASGDALGAWYIEQQGSKGNDVTYTAVGGAQLRAAGADIYLPLTQLSVVGVVEIIKHIPRLYRIGRELARHIGQGGYDELVVIDFPGFNLRLIKHIRTHYPQIRIAYLSPPQLWVWGAWRVKKLKRYADRVIVLYPFEVAWYAKRGVKALFWGSPVAQRLRGQSALPARKRERRLTLMPGSRAQELRLLMPHFAATVRMLCARVPHLALTISVAPSLTRAHVEHALAPYHPEEWGCAITYVTDHNELMEHLKRSACVLTKPGTNTLELALLGVPGAVLYKTSWLTYWLARMVVNVGSMTLPNLLMKGAPDFAGESENIAGKSKNIAGETENSPGEPENLEGKRRSTTFPSDCSTSPRMRGSNQPYPEFIQGDCKPEAVADALAYYLELQQKSPDAYDAWCEKLRSLCDVLDP